MTITYADSLNTHDGLSLMQNFHSSSGFERGIVLYLPGTGGPHFMGLKTRTMSGMVEALNHKEGLPSSGMTGFAGKRFLSLHFSASAYDGFLGAMGAERMPVATVQIGDKGRLWHQAAQHWAGKRNWFDLKDQPQIELRQVPGTDNVYNYEFPDLTSLREFYLRMRRGTFEHAARCMEDGTFIPGRVYTLEPHTQPAPTAEKR